MYHTDAKPEQDWERQSENLFTRVKNDYSMDTFCMNGIALDLNIKPNGIYFKVLFKMCVRLGLHLYLILVELKTWYKSVKVMV